MKRTFAIGATSFLMLAACQTVTTTTPSTKTLEKATSVALCANATAEIRDDFETARVNGCDVISDSKIEISIKPENPTDPQGEPINNSAWYGFRVDPIREGNLDITLQYYKGKHRYHPKISYDGTNWEFLSEGKINKITEDKTVISVETDNRPFFISAQEIFTPLAHNKWTDKLAQKTYVTKSEIGRSRENRPIYMLEIETDPSKKKPYVMLVGRQHPPELTGALALIPFSEKVLDNSALSNTFLDKFNVLIVPMINPDGVVNGNWRFNMGGMDLNRDWGPFSQPETQAVLGALGRFKSGDEDIAFFLDFHSTGRNLLYTQADDEPTSPPMFAKDWVKAVDDRLDDEVYPFTREARHNSGKPISKNYMYETYGISAITYEVGDATPRPAIKLSAEVFAEEMMRLLLQHYQVNP